MLGGLTGKEVVVFNAVLVPEELRDSMGLKHESMAERCSSADGSLLRVEQNLESMLESGDAPRALWGAYLIQEVKEQPFFFRRFLTRLWACVP